MKIFHLACFSSILFLLVSCGTDMATPLSPKQAPIQIQPTTPPAPITVVATGTTITPIQTVSGVTLEIENTGAVSDKNIYKNEKYGFQITLPKEVSIDEYKDVDSGKVSLRLYFNTVDTSWSGGIAELASLAVTSIAEYEATKAKCIENKSEYEDIACSLGMGAPIIGMANGNIFTFYSAHEGPTDSNKLPGIFGVDTYEAIPGVLKSNFSPLAK